MQPHVLVTVLDIVEGDAAIRVIDAPGDLRALFVRDDKMELVGQQGAALQQLDSLQLDGRLHGHFRQTGTQHILILFIAVAVQIQLITERQGIQGRNQLLISCPRPGIGIKRLILLVMLGNIQRVRIIPDRQLRNAAEGGTG